MEREGRERKRMKRGLFMVVWMFKLDKGREMPFIWEIK